MRVLVVDDSKAMRMIVIRSLRQCEFGDLEISEAVNGVEALERIKEQAPHLVLSDWNMPEMNGIELLRAVRELDYRFPFGFITSESSGDVRTQADEAGANFIINKPFCADSMKLALEPVLTAS